jgi:uncharacterized membrane protein
MSVSSSAAGDRQRWSVVRDAWRTKLWPLPALGVGVTVGFGVALPRLDAAVDGRLPSAVGSLLFSGGPEAAFVATTCPSRLPGEPS